MGAPLAILIVSVGIAGLFFLNRDNSVRNSRALWLPIIWIGIVGSRPVSAWFGIGPEGGSLASTLEGNPLDAAIFAALLTMGIMILLGRRKKTSAYLAVSGPIIIYFLYCLISVAWSPFHGPAFKRWIKAIGDFVMVLVILTDGEPMAALRGLYSRLGFVLFPFSIVLIRYTSMGRGYDPSGNPANTGVTLNKNSLGLIVFVISLGVLWNIRSLLSHKDEPNRGRRMVAQFTLLAFGLALLEMSHSATSVICFLLGAALMLVTSLHAIRRSPRRVHALCILVVLVGGLAMLLGGDSVLSSVLGRGSKMSGRTYIWEASLAAAENPLIGTGFESFWNANASKVNQALHQVGFLDMSDLASAHNGYLEVYLDLGWVGVCLIALILIHGYRHASRAFQQNPEVGRLMLVYVATATFYSITEAGFRMMTPNWIFLLLAVVGAKAINAGILGRSSIKAVGSATSALNSQACREEQIALSTPV